MGEYGALLGGPVIVFCNEPKYTLAISPGDFSMKGIHSESPAGKLILKYQDLFSTKKIIFTDPYEGQGGLGASTAQFLGLYAFIQGWDSARLKELSPRDLELLLTEYQECAWDGSGAAPSGADLISQIYGGFVFFHRQNNFKIEKLQWPSTKIGMMLLKNSVKVPTHEHLKKINLDFATFSDGKKDIWNQSQDEVFRLKKFFEKDQAQDLFLSVQNFLSFLNSQDFICNETKVALNDLGKIQGVHTVKGCGALGADFLWLTYDISKEAEIVNQLKNLNYKNIYSLKNFSSDGLTIIKENL